MDRKLSRAAKLEARKALHIRRLGMLLDAYMADGSTQRSFAQRVGKPDSQISDLKDGRTPSFGDTVARDICEAVGLPGDWMNVDDDALAQSLLVPLFPKITGGVVARMGDSLAGPSLLESTLIREKSAPPKRALLGDAVTTPLRPVKAISDPEQIEHDIIQVPRYTLRASAGSGQPVLDIDERGTPNYCRREWATRNGYHPEKLFSIVAVGDSMVPTIADGASLIVLRAETITNGRVHVICRDGECFVKRLYKQFDGSLLVKSDNEKHYRDIVIDANDELGFYIVGLVVSVTNNI